jgi:GNAT superfamily N-acetyltransferase
MQVGVVDPAATRELRRSVLRPHLAPGDPMPGDELAVAVHIAACDDDGTVVGTCFVFPEPVPWLPGAGDAWHLRQMATLPGRRGQGVGTQVLDAALDHVAKFGAAVVWCHAREQAVPFYSRHGFRRHGGIFIDAEHPIPHVRMYRELDAVPTSSER